LLALLQNIAVAAVYGFNEREAIIKWLTPETVEAVKR
jgi:hypothetical protein